MALGRPIGILLAKELRTEFRTRELLVSTLVFVLIVLVLFSFTFDPTTAESRRFGPVLLWLALLFAGSLMLHPSFTREQSNDTLVASAEATAGLFEDRPALSAVWVGVLAAFDTIFLTVTWLFGEYLLEE